MRCNVKEVRYHIDRKLEKKRVYIIYPGREKQNVYKRDNARDVAWEDNVPRHNRIPGQHQNKDKMIAKLMKNKNTNTY